MVKKPKPKEKLIIPKVIEVPDKIAKRLPDGRYYVDLRGHRYWKNYKDGKYYIFNASMYTDDSFKPPK